MLLPIRNIATNGLQLDRLDFDLPPNVLADGENIYIKDGMIRSIEGEEFYFNLPDAQNIYSWARSDGDKTIVVTSNGQANNVFVYENPTRSTDVSPNGGLPVADWQITQHGEFAIFSADGQVPMYLGPNDSQLAPLPGWTNITDNGQSSGNAIDVRAGLVISYQNHLVAFRVQMGQNAGTQSILWSAPVAIDTIATDWNYGAADSTSGLDIAPAELGEVVTAKQIGRSVLIYHAHGLSKMAYVGNPQIYQITPIDNDRGLFNRKALAAMKNVHYCVDIDKIYAHDGQRALYIADEKVQRWFSERVGKSDLVRVVTLVERDEVLFLFGEIGSSVITDALIYNQRVNAWTKRKLPTKWHKKSGDVAAYVVDVARVKVLPTYAVTYANIGATHEQETRSYNDLTRVDPLDSLVFLTSAGDVYRANYGAPRRTEASLTSWLLQTSIDLDEMQKSVKPIKSIRALYPQLIGSGDLIITVGGHNGAQDGITWGRPQTFKIGRDKKVDLRGAWRYLAIKIEQPGDGYFWLSGWDVDVMLKGGR